MNQEKIDDLLFEVAHLSNGDINTVFDSIFSFFRRKTDLYVLRKENDDAESGFPPGKAEAIVMRAFHQQWRLQKDYQPKSKDDPPTTEMSSTPKRDNNRQNLKENAFLNEDNRTLRPPSISTVNGGSADLYHWTQTLDSLQIEFPLRQGLTKSDVDVAIGTEYISISVPRVDMDFARQLRYTVDPKECSWHIDSHGKNGFLKSIIIDLLKKEDHKSWWEAVFQEDKEKYSAQNLRPQQNITELADDEQAAIYHTIEDHMRKEKGLPTKEEERVAQLLKQARDLPGSPFLQSP
eukprot:Protomagalhaensia_wolfi_Nauph_80__5884@NODE_760_length_2023_cov_26_120464_g571_i0_p2_GENE_NODE_760_length_2023_cov_26_120464_g571_i0NODE_760_length_2023_cov_26_120464_g571_i0_p2_ORF_typecomplete_len292_score53_69CS/PF04969_16/6_5e11Nudc_N/PF14050_6/2_6e09CCDC168_N/PF15804_5/5_4e03CCDC168_N/PF15804_5/0_081_NODE_760_length_2023_cov_26_120464_g571_i01591034